MFISVILDSFSTSREAGRITGRLIFLAVVPVFIIALIYWWTGRSWPQPMRFSHAISRWWIWLVGLVAGFILLLLLAFQIAASEASGA